MSGRRTQSESRITSDKTVSDSWGDSLDRDISFGNRSPNIDLGNYVYHECDIYLLKQIDLGKDEDFTREKIHTLLDKYYNAKHTQCKLYMFNDTMRFERMKSIGRRSFHLELRYEDIKRCSTFRSKPQALVLCVVNHLHDKRTYELFRCKSLTDINRICNLIDKATQSNSFCLSNKLPIIYNDNIKQNIINNNKNRAISVESLQPSLLRPNSLIGDYSEYLKKTCDECIGSWKITKSNEFNKNTKVKQSTTIQCLNSSTAQFNSPLTSINKITNESIMNLNNLLELHNDNKLHKLNKLPRIKINQNITFPYNNWDDNITYLHIHPIYGPQINEYGPVYMYAVQL
ncbi:hypothetical protein MN116_002275 [Schistosoma mekongi]|uniref:Trematode PH-like domain-containing protein n=1 Tax=Schistosoma mekongi TaxID=38744 RepID=A0AAE2D8I6_SCHME|nr:hypothetical protein MN116_002275 [Schistosoma mekongi]